MTLGFLEVRVQSSSKPFIEYTTEKIYIYLFLTVINTDQYRIRMERAAVLDWQIRERKR
jgi:hypothetical protein